MKPAHETGWWPLIQDEKSRQRICELREAASPRLNEPRWEHQRQAIESIRDLRASVCKAGGPVVEIGLEEDLNGEQKQRLQTALRSFMPWKKGPFSICGQAIDAEWRSDWKWQRFAPFVRSLQGQVVADIGCNNGYYMYRMLAEGAERVIGFEPMARHALNFELLQNLYPTPALDFELLGAESLDLFTGVFDSIFCLGILYHHTDPVSLLRKMASALRQRGRIFIDCQGIPGEDSVALTPASRYAGATGVWFLPTRSCLENWVRRAGYTRLRWIFTEVLDPAEQRRTEWAPIKSLSDFLDPQNRQRTIEGYPAPHRFYLMIQP